MPDLLQELIRIEQILERMENIRLVDGKNSFEYEDTFVLRGLKELHIAFDARH